MNKLKVGSLFSGIGGFELGLEATGGFETAWLCEPEDFPRRVLAKRWPGVPIHSDITTLRGGEVEQIDVLTGGFPCQDISAAGKGVGIRGERSGLWFEFARLIGELRPRYVLAENSPLLRRRGLNAVLGSLAALGYDAEWDCVPARAVGAPHQRDRIWIVAYPSSQQRERGRALRNRRAEPADQGVRGAEKTVSDPHNQGSRRGIELQSGREEGRHLDTEWPAEPDVGRMVDGVPARVDRLRCLGNACVPKIPEWIGNRVLEWEATNMAEGVRS